MDQLTSPLIELTHDTSRSQTDWINHRGNWDKKKKKGLKNPLLL